ncbi:uncharacterized protein LOC131941486 [Physella acuta]|uniref:uncharacterized protein LOC131941486 n=1 Tax=Physella acuta TaxID=109671 RepID=UPI0027DE86C3|nr:uncharacterized protein LOC131941486 [Physella acuta]
MKKLPVAFWLQQFLDLFFTDYECGGQRYGLECEKMCKCSGLRCGDAPVVQFGSWMQCSHHINSVCMLECERGYSVEGNETITCQGDATWTAPGVCTILKCSSAVQVPNGKWIFCKHRECQLKCNKGFTLEGNTQITCQDNLQWTAPGRCIHTSNSCDKPWYGPNCYYKNLFYLASAVYPQDFRVNSSCFLTDVLDIKFDAETYFISLGLNFLRKEQQDVNVTVSKKLFNGTVVLCSKPLIYWVDEFTFDFECETRNFVTEIGIKLSFHAYICHVTVNGGRNLIKESNVLVTSDGNDSYVSNEEYQVVFDDYEDDDNCLIVAKPGRSIACKSTFKWPRVVYQILIYTSGKTGSVMKDFKVELLNDEYDVVFSKTFHNFSPFYKINVPYSGLVLSIVLNASDVLTLCEIQVFGECGKRRHGIDCSEVCSITCSDQDCQFTGVCKKCVRNRIGEYCLDSVDQIYNFSLNSTPLQMSTTFQRARFMTSDEIYTIITLLIIVFLVILCLCFVPKPKDAKSARE